jgi:hypothetical protein
VKRPSQGPDKFDREPNFGRVLIFFCRLGTRFNEINFDQGDLGQTGVGKAVNKSKFGP